MFSRRREALMKVLSSEVSSLDRGNWLRRTYANPLPNMDTGNEIWRRRRTWRNEHWESPAALILEGCRKKKRKVDVPPVGLFPASVESFVSAFLFSSASRSFGCNAVRSDFFRGIKAGQGAAALSPSRRYAVGQRRKAERELGTAAARGLGGSPGLRWQSVFHRPQHPANFMDWPKR